MTTALPPKPEVFTTNISNASNAVLKNISWQTYQAMLADMGDHRSIRLAYDRGTLEIKMPLEFHEAINRLLERIIVALTEELELDIKSFGSTTFNRKDLEVGVEPDSCFYIQNAHLVRRFQIDIEKDPAPDLVVEVDVHSSSIRRLDIYKQLGVPEIWGHTRTGIKIYNLRDSEYVEQEYSVTFPIMSGEALDRFLALSESTDDNKLIREFRAWLRQRLGQ
ncbi:MAG: Uma2 family endonuclease [Pseudanabaena sp.]